jgi:hypothetical protein
LLAFHNPVVTSNLVFYSQIAHHGAGGGSIARQRENGRKLFVLKILTSKLFATKILQTLFANRAPRKALHRGWGEGVLTSI